MFFVGGVLSKKNIPTKIQKKVKNKKNSKNKQVLT